MIIAIEGHDGVGKTTLAKRLAKELGFRYVKNPFTELFGISEKRFLQAFDSLVKQGNPIVIASFLGVNEMLALDFFKGQNLILDRHILQNYFWNYTDKTKPVFELIMREFPKPDLTVLLCATKETRKSRIEKRNKKDSDLSNQVVLNAEDQKLIDILEEHNYHYCTIDTNNQTPEAVFEKAKQIVAENQ